MIKKITFLILLSALTTALFSQNTGNLLNKKTTINQKEEENITSIKPTVISGSKQYDILKAEGKLAHFEVRMPLVNKPLKLASSTKTTSTNPTPCDPSPSYSGPPIPYTSQDDAISTIPFPFNFCFYGATYTSCNVSINGNIQFITNSTAYTSTGFPSNTVNMIAPFWADCYLTNGSSVKIDVYPTRMVISWDSIGYYNNKNDLVNSFQCVITDGTDGILPLGKNVGFYYRDMQWTTGDVTGTGGFPTSGTQSPATVGINQGNGIDYYLIGRFGVPGSTYDGPLGADDGISWLNGKRFYFNACPPVGANVEPISTLIGYCDTLKVCGNDTLFIKNSFLAPEVTQSVSITASAPTLGSSFSYSVIPNTNSSDIFMVVNGGSATAGYHTVTMTATDNGIPVLSSTQNFVVYVNQSSLNNLNGGIVITPSVGICPGNTATASVTVSGGIPDSYLWNNGSTSSSASFTTMVAADSLIFVTLTSGQCKKTITSNIKINPIPNALISGNLTYCNGNAANTTLTATNTTNPLTQGPHTYNWATSTGSLSSANSPTVTVNGGVYTVTVTNQFGCTSIATTTVVMKDSPKYTLTSLNAISGGSVYCINQDSARIGITYGLSSSTTCGLGTSNCLTSNTLAVGTGTSPATSSYINPFVSFSKSSHHQYLFTATELISAGVQAGKISSIAFDLASVSTATLYPNFTVKLKCTNATDLTSTFDNSGLNLVYSSNTAIALGINTLNFSQPYIWDGNSNILIDVCHDLISSGSTASSQAKSTTTAFTSVTGDYSATTPMCGSSAIGVTNTKRPNIIFGNCLSQQSGSQFSITVTPTTGILMPLGQDSIKIKLPNTIATTCYTISLKNSIGGCTKDTVICVNATQGITQATLSATPNPVCAGSPVTLNAVGTLSTYTIQYNNGSGVINSVNTPATFNASQSGINTYTLIAQGFCSAPVNSVIANVSVTPIANLTMTPLSNITTCMSGTATLNTNVGSSNSANNGMPYTYAWTSLPGNIPAAGTNNLSTYTTVVTLPTTLAVIVNGKCATSITSSVIVQPFINNLQVSIVDSLSICADSKFTLNALSIGGRPKYNYNWTIQPNTNSVSNANPAEITSPVTQGVYNINVVVTDSCGYIANDNQLITVLPPCDVIIPNIITPNGDGKNDVFKIKNLEYHPNSELTIFDRWGRKVYESTNYANDWKADNLTDGTYFYVLNVPDDKKYNGFITLLKAH